MQIKDRVFLITGANRGIGSALVDAALAAGAGRIYAASRDGNVSHNDKRVRPLKLDVADASSVQSAAKTAADTEILINNAGVLDWGNLFEASFESFQNQMNVNLWGNLRMDQAFAPIVKTKGGAIVNILTLLSLASMPGAAAYNASKAAAWSLALSLRASLAGSGVSVVNVFPGAVDTQMLAGVEMPKTAPGDVAAAVIAGLIEDREDIFPDPMSQSVYAAWRIDHKAVEKQFASM